MELWKAIDWIELIPIDKYQISSYGRLKNLYTGNILGQWKQSKQDRIIAMLTSADFEQTTHKRRSTGDSTKVRPKAKTRLIQIGRCVAIAFVPLPEGIKDPKRLQVRHIDGNFMNNHADNLEWVMGFHQQYTVEERRQLFQIIHDNLDKPSKEIAKICSETLHRKITAGQVSAMTYQDNADTPKLKQFETLGLDASKYMRDRQNRKLDQSEVRMLCELLVKCNGDVAKVLSEIADDYPSIRREVIQNILYKNHYTAISDQYFDYFGRGEFHPIESNK